MLLHSSALEQFGIYGVWYVPSDVYVLSWVFPFIPFCTHVWSFSSYFVSLIVNFVLFIYFFSVGTLRDPLVYSRFISIISSFLSAVYLIINEIFLFNSGRFFYTSLLFILFSLILVANLMGLTPYSIALTSHFSVTFAMAFLLFFMLNLSGLFYNGIFLLSLFFPVGTPGVIVPLLVFIEFISYIARMFSLSIRLFANITAGHILVKIISGFVFLLVHFVAVFCSGWALLSLLWGLEFFISILQAYVFLVLVTIYTQDSMALH